MLLEDWKIQKNFGISWEKQYVDNDELFLVAVVESLLNLMHCVLRVSSVGLKSEMMRLTKVVALQVYWLQR